MKQEYLISIAMAGLLFITTLTAKAQDPLPYTSLPAYISDLKSRIPGAGSERFVEPPQADRDVFQGCIQQLLVGNTDDARTSRWGELRA